MNITNQIRSACFNKKVYRIIAQKIDVQIGNFARNLEHTLIQLSRRPSWLNIELTNLCNAKCIFCPYQYQKRQHRVMSDKVFYTILEQYRNINGGSIGLTPIVGEPFADPGFLDRVKAIRNVPGSDQIFVLTNAIAMDRFKTEDILTSGLTSIYISTAGFEKSNYDKIYRSHVKNAYEQMRDNVTRLVRKNSELGNPVKITIGLRTNRALHVVMKDSDFQPVLEHSPLIDFTWVYRDGGGRITKDSLPAEMKLKSLPVKNEVCYHLYRGPIVLNDGAVLACNCIGAMDALEDLTIGNIFDDDIESIWQGEKMKNLRQQFSEQGVLNKTCRNCTSYKNLDIWRTRRGNLTAQSNHLRHQGVHPPRSSPKGYFEDE